MNRSLGAFIVAVLAAPLVAIIACDETAPAVSAPTDAATVDSEVAPGMDASSSDSTSPPVSDANGRCHEMANVAPVVRATYVGSPFPTGAGQGGDIVSGKYVLTALQYFSDTPNLPNFFDAGGTDASPEAGAALDVYWKTTVDVSVSLGTTLTRTWHISYTGDFKDRPERRETLLLEPETPTSVKISIVCTDAPLEGIAEYTATPTEYRLYLGDDVKRVEVYTKQ